MAHGLKKVSSIKNSRLRYEMIGEAKPEIESL